MSCAHSTPRAALHTSPRLDTPAQAAAPCPIYTLPEKPTLADLEAGYGVRGAQLVACNAARQLAVDAHELEHKAEDAVEAARAKRARAWWRF